MMWPVDLAPFADLFVLDFVGGRQRDGAAPGRIRSTRQP